MFLRFKKMLHFYMPYEFCFYLKGGVRRRAEGVGYINKTVNLSYEVVSKSESTVENEKRYLVSPSFLPCVFGYISAAVSNTP